MDTWNQLLAMLDNTSGFSNRIGSTVKKARQGYDEKKNEHVISLERILCRSRRAGKSPGGR